MIQTFVFSLTNLLSVREASASLRHEIADILASSKEMKTCLE
jgi:hypothetical protein